MQRFDPSLHRVTTDDRESNITDEPDWSSPEVYARGMEFTKMVQETFAEMAEKGRRMGELEREYYRGLLPYRLAAKWETRAYWSARMAAWDEVYAGDASPDLLQKRDEWGGILGVR